MSKWDEEEFWRFCCENPGACGDFDPCECPGFEDECWEENHPYDDEEECEEEEDP